MMRFEIDFELYKKFVSKQTRFNLINSNQELYDKCLNESKSKFLNDTDYKPGKTCYRNMSALNKCMYTLIMKDVTSIAKEDWPKKGASSYPQYSRVITNFDLGNEIKINKIAYVTTVFLTNPTLKRK